MSGITHRRGASGRSGRALLAVVAAVALEALLLLGVVVLYAVELLGAGAVDAAGATATAALAGAAGLGLGACARGLLAGRRWARAPVLTWQLLQAAVAVPLLAGPWWWAGAGLLVLAVVAGVGLFAPSVVAATTAPQPPPVL
ncbi:hypothetical protein [Quadrisphaera sp. DSM 44207]|uniref:hypothetical protein n=1 Tax=Quadrisphaera sp. DSM 44207 TaxID=1881057 RepID=UPI000885EED7|nr:hypothetical protein [Quadrisphaera sp. DSM 44207]SDQ08633.1 hypothetical protein SAMN05428996_0448 [Quadrisphaera sp. DSM 44207]